MKLFVIAGLLVLSTVATAQTCKLEMYGPRGEFITSIRTPNDQRCLNAARACNNWRAWYYAPANSQCYIVEDNGYATIDYVRYPDYDVYYGYPGSPYTRVARIPQTTTTTTTTTTEICEYDRRGREYCRVIESQTNTQPNPTPRPRTEPTPAPRPRTEPTPPTPRPRTEPTPPTTTPTTPTTPNTNPVPAPTPAPDSDAIRAIEAGETIIFNSALHMVVSVPNPNFYNLKPMTGRERDREVIKDVARHYVAVTRGCHAGFCASDSVIVVSSASYAAVAGIEYDGQLVIKTVTRPEVMSFDVNPSTLAWTKGCTPEATGKVCVGNVVVKGRIYYTVVGIQMNGSVVIENNDGPKKLTTNILPNTLVIVQ